MGRAEPVFPAATGAASLGLTRGQVVQELGWDTDSDEQLRDEVMNLIDGELVEETVDAVDVVLLWWRNEDGDVVDGLVDSLTDLSASGCIWLVTPKVGRTGHVDPTDLAEGALTAGLSLTRSASVSQDWQAHRIVRPKGARK